MAFRVDTDARTTTVDVTELVADAIPPGCDTGTCTVFVEHTTSGLVLQENEPRLREDIEQILADVVPDDGHAHDQLDGNADAHLRAMLLGPSVTVPIRDGSLALGTWQTILLVECDGPRTRRLSVTVVDASD